MQIEEKISELKKQLPHGAQKIIAERAGVTPKIVGNYLSGVTGKTVTRARILKEAAKYLKEYNKLEKDILKNISA